MSDGLKAVAKPGDRIGLNSWTPSLKRFVKWEAEIVKIASSGVTVKRDDGVVVKMGWSHILVPKK
jgi:hypothetical protein